MDEFRRYAIYHSPPAGPLADLAAAWLGWDPAARVVPEAPEVPGLPRPREALTEAPRKYGFHATLRAPFRPADGIGVAELRQSVGALAQSLAPVRLDGLEVTVLGRFVALRPVGPLAPLQALAASVVEASNPWRAPLSPEEVARRRPERLTDAQRTHLDTWGYPFVFDEFRFHMTLSGPLPVEERDAVRGAMTGYLGPAIPAPYPITDLCLFGERPDGRFQLVERYALTG